MLMDDILDYIPVTSESDYVIWQVKRAFAQRRWIKRTQRLCKIKQRILGVFVLFIPIVVFYFVFLYHKNILYVFPTLWMVFWGLFLLFTKRNFFYDFWSLDHPEIKDVFVDWRE